VEGSRYSVNAIPLITSQLIIQLKDVCGSSPTHPGFFGALIFHHDKRFGLAKGSQKFNNLFFGEK
jgi:hypothetical protein